MLFSYFPRVMQQHYHDFDSCFWPPDRFVSNILSVLALCVWSPPTDYSLFNKTWHCPLNATCDRICSESCERIMHPNVFIVKLFCLKGVRSLICLLVHLRITESFDGFVCLFMQLLQISCWVIVLSLDYHLNFLPSQNVSPNTEFTFLVFCYWLCIWNNGHHNTSYNVLCSDSFSSQRGFHIVAFGINIISVNTVE